MPGEDNGHAERRADRMRTPNGHGGRGVAPVRRVLPVRRYRPLEDPISRSLGHELGAALLAGSVWKLLMLSGPGEPYASVGGALISLATLVLWEVVARRSRLNRLEPPFWILAIVAGMCVWATTFGLGFGLGSGSLSCWVLIGLSSMILFDLVHNGASD